MSDIQLSATKRSILMKSSDLKHPLNFPTNYQSTTKYSLLTFVPFSLFFQFKRIANIYFLITAVLQSISQISPLSPFSAVAPLIFVLSVSIAREGIEDYLRYRSDRQINLHIVEIYEDGEFTKTTSKDIKVGNIVKIHKDNIFPCDLLMLSNSSSNSLAYIETANIDGEKNLKTRSALNKTQSISLVQIVSDLTEIECDLPNANIYSFNGNLIFGGENVFIGKNNLLLAGAVLRNTAWVVGVAVYTGPETKIRMNMIGRRVKQSTIEKKVNTYILYILALQFCLCLIPSILAYYWIGSQKQDKEFSIGEQGLQAFLLYFTYFLLLNTMLPISLIISLEILKIIQGYFMHKNQRLYSYLRDQPCKVSSFSLNEELGMVQEIFTDKTGTLTCNKMMFRICAIGEKVYGDNAMTIINSTIQSVITQNDRNQLIFTSKELQEDFSSSNSSLVAFKIGKIRYQRELIKDFFICMALCHECLVETNGEEVKYIGQSPDEAALLDAAMRVGVKFIKKTEDLITLQVTQDNKVREEQFELISVFEFNSERKRNSVVVKKLQDSTYWVFVKGADNEVCKLLADPYNQNCLKIEKELKSFSEKGLRTLMLAYRELDFEEFTYFKSNFDQACKEIQDRENHLFRVASIIENNLELLGCTGVEDCLQEDVPETIQDFLSAKIKIYMLTGDKLETAENIARTCSLINENTQLFKLDHKDSGILESSISEYLDIIEHIDNDFSLIVEGDTFKLIMTQIGKSEIEGFWTLCDSCKSVIFCRMTPGQKKDIVKAVKTRTGRVCLTVGDGANDVPMILEGDVGVGIFGEEGMQAVQASDYAVGEFRLLWELLFVHGRYNYLRQSEMILYFIYKNLVFTIPQFWFAFYCGFSGQTVYDDWYITVYNMILTALPLMIKGVLEKDIIISERFDGEVIDSQINNVIKRNVPKLYELGRLNQYFKTFDFCKWVLTGIFHSVIVFFLPLYVCSKNVTGHRGQQTDYVFFSTTSFTCIILVVTLKLSITTRFWTWYHMVGLTIFSLFLYVSFILVYDILTPSIFAGSIYYVLSSGEFYLIIFSCICLILTTDTAVNIYYKLLYPETTTKLLNRFKYSSVNLESNATE